MPCSRGASTRATLQILQPTCLSPGSLGTTGQCTIRHPEILQVLGCPTGQGRYSFTGLCIFRWKTWTHLNKLMDTITLSKGYFSDPRKNLQHEPTEKTTMNYSIKQNRREPPQREHKCMYLGSLSLRRLHFAMAVLHLQIYVASRNKSLQEDSEELISLPLLTSTIAKNRQGNPKSPSCCVY